MNFGSGRLSSNYVAKVGLLAFTIMVTPDHLHLYVEYEYKITVSLLCYIKKTNLWSFRRLKYLKIYKKF